MLAIDYPYIKAYGKYVGLSAQKIQEQIAQAQREEAPSDVVRLIRGDWTRLKDYDEQWKKCILDNIENINL